MRTKSLYDPCPYSYRIPTNGTYNLFPKDYPTWTQFSYLGGAKWTLSAKSTWLPVAGRRAWNTGLFIYVGSQIGYWTATSSSAIHGYVLRYDYNKAVRLNDNGWARSEGTTLRCIEDCDCLKRVTLKKIMNYKLKLLILSLKKYNHYDSITNGCSN